MTAYVPVAAHGAAPEHIQALRDDKADSKIRSHKHEADAVGPLKAREHGAVRSHKRRLYRRHTGAVQGDIDELHLYGAKRFPRTSANSNPYIYIYIYIRPTPAVEGYNGQLTFRTRTRPGSL